MLKTAWAFVRHAGWAVVVTLLYGYTLNGPFLFGRNAGSKLVVTGLGGYLGTGVFGGIVNAVARRGKQKQARLVYWMLVASAGLSFLAYIGHRLYFDGTRIEYSTGTKALYWLWIFGLSALMRTFLSSVLASVGLSRTGTEPNCVVGQSAGAAAPEAKKRNH
jgi:hypothetical protein